MGCSSYSSDAYSFIKDSVKAKGGAEKVVNKTAIVSEMDPKDVAIREARDSEANPNSLAIMVWLDVTGSMQGIPKKLVNGSLGTLMDTLIKHGIANPSVFFGAIGDTEYDDSALQVGQFESGAAELNKWLTSAYLEGGGGGNAGESYLLAYLFAGRNTSIDCFEKRGQKGFLFTIGDEPTLNNVKADWLKKSLGYTQASDLTVKELLIEAQRMYEVFHIHVKEGSNGNSSRSLDSWKEILGQRVLVLENSDMISELIASTVAMFMGEDLRTVTSSFTDSVARSVTTSLAHLESTIVKKGSNTGIVKL